MPNQESEEMAKRAEIDRQHGMKPPSQEEMPDNLNIEHRYIQQSLTIGETTNYTRTDIHLQALAALKLAENALDQALDDMGEAGKSVCQASKAQMIQALETITGIEIIHRSDYNKLSDDQKQKLFWAGKTKISDEEQHSEET